VTDAELPELAKWPIFPFEGDIRVKPVLPLGDRDPVRSGEPGGAACQACAQSDDDQIWVDDNWRVHTAQPTGVPLLLFLEPRAHVDMDGLDETLAAELGQMIVRVDRAMQKVEGVGRVYVNRWGDGAMHLHLWFYARPFGTRQMFGPHLPFWAGIVPPTPADVWNRNAAVVAAELAKHGGRAILR
jgi:hypothetical protein